jgi:hypothetical protein
MLSDTCFDFNSAIFEFVRERLSQLKAELDNYDQPPFDYEHGEIAAIRYAIAAFENDQYCANMLALVQILELVQEFHDTTSADADLRAFKEALFKTDKEALFKTEIAMLLKTLELRQQHQRR